MIFFKNDSTDPFYNLALEEAILKSNIKEDIFMLWQNHNTIVVGRNQNTLEEINLDAVRRDDVRVVRRLSGGGAVYHDNGNLNFTFIKDANGPREYSAMLQPIINVLHKLGLNAAFIGKNDIEVDGKKISGNAQYIYHDRLLHHGTILFDVDLSKMPHYLNVDPTKIKSKGIKSVPARMLNIKSLLPENFEINDFKLYIINELAQENVKLLDVPDSIKKIANKLAKEKFSKWDWNFGSSPEFTYRNKIRFEGKGIVEVFLKIKNGKIDSAKFYGDFLGSQGTEGLENSLIGCSYERNELKEVIDKSDYHLIFGSLFTPDELLEVMYTIK